MLLDDRWVGHIWNDMYSGPTSPPKMSWEVGHFKLPPDLYTMSPGQNCQHGYVQTAHTRIVEIAADEDLSGMITLLCHQGDSPCKA